MLLLLGVCRFVVGGVFVGCGLRLVCCGRLWLLACVFSGIWVRWIWCFALLVVFIVVV